MLAALPPPMTRSTTSKTTRSSSRIRFAPLPDPRRAVLIAENGDEIPLQAWLDLPSPYASVTSSPVKKFEVLDDDEFDDDGDKDTEAASIPAAVSLAALCYQNGTNAGGSTTSSLRLSTEPSTTAGTMSRSNSEHSLMTMGTTPSGSIYSSPSTSTSDTANTPTPISPSSSAKSSSRGSFFRRFRKSSSASTNSNNEDTDSGLQRWASASSGGSLGFPISRTQSAQSDKSHARSLSALNPFSGSTSSLSSQRHKSRSRTRPSSAQGLGLIGMLHDQKEGKSPTKMLNGRVYGAKRHQQNPNQKNPFANVSTNPDFVEWGYGGMGSVKSSGVGGSVWGKVQSSQDDADDGGGMEWVRKRKEQREKEKLEREKKLLEETLKEEEAPAAVEDTPTVSTPTVDSGTVTPTTNASAEHVLSAVKIPAPPHAPKHHHTGSQVSIHTVTETNLYEDREKKAIQEEEPKSDEDEDEQKDDDEEQKDDDEEEDDDEEDDEAERRRCMQSIGAGVEKISRHKS